MFNGVHDTESLTSFLHNTRRDYAIKVHHGHGGGMCVLYRQLKQGVDILITAQIIITNHTRSWI
jgi:hypothetical protein